MSEQDGVGDAAADGAPEEVPAGYTAHGGTDRCADCMYFSAHDATSENPPGDCTVHGPPPYVVQAGGWCPAWEPDDGSLPDFSFA